MVNLVVMNLKPIINHNGWLYGYVSRPHIPKSTHKTTNGLLTIQRVVRF